jgi:hypothetical protein
LSVTITGLRFIQQLLAAIPRLVREPFAETVFEIMEDGKRVMRNHVEETIWESPSLGDKTTGDLARSIDGVIEFRDGGEGNPMSATIEIGSRLPYAGFASREIGTTVMNRVVFMDPPGRFRFIGTRPPIPGHPFLERTMSDMIELLSTKYEGKFTAAWINLQRDTASWSGTDELFRSGMTGLFGD